MICSFVANPVRLAIPRRKILQRDVGEFPQSSSGPNQPTGLGGGLGDQADPSGSARDSQKRKNWVADHSRNCSPVLYPSIAEIPEST
jgi:hypothetical protein